MSLITWADDKFAKYGTHVRQGATESQAHKALHAIRFGGAAVDNPAVNDVMQWVEQPFIAAFVRKPNLKLHRASRVVGVFTQSGVDFALVVPFIAAALLVRCRSGKMAAGEYITKHEAIVAGAVAYLGTIIAGIYWVASRTHLAAKFPKYTPEHSMLKKHIPRANVAQSIAEARVQAAAQALGDFDRCSNREKPCFLISG